MTTKLEGIDARSKSAWDDSYVLEMSAVLWSEAAVPHVARAASMAAEAGARIALDLPCGDGRNIRTLAAAVPIVVAADSSANALGIAAQLCRRNGIRNCVTLQTDVFSTSFTDDQFDFVFCWDLLGHLRDVGAAIAELLRITAPGGLLLGSVFALGDSTRGIDMKNVSGEEWIYRDRFYYRFYAREDVEALVTGAGFDLVSIELATWNEPPHEGFREYPHEHQSWVFVLRKRGE